ncbi:protein 60A-like [Malaya genurostris]|uniref:protein 60A-like n=1 Tax=Malaya genurostris TaxID=325434 RepID=UPI0026F3A7C6|nr:protein 60A-like [Malaya genurostris]
MLCFVLLLLSVVVGAVVRPVVSFSSATGFYIDNGQNQTVREKTVTMQDRQEIEHEILELLGLPDRPNEKHIHPSLRKSAPQFLLNIYHKFTEEGSARGKTRQKRSAGVGAEGSRFYSRSLFTVADERAIEESDVIMSFLNKGNRNMPKIRHRRYGERLWFDTSETGKDSGSVVYASLRIYKNSTLDRWSAITKGRSITVRASIVREYDPKRGGEHTMEFLADQTVPFNYEGWLEINVTDAMIRWMASTISNKGIFVDAFHSESPQKNVRPQDLGLILSNKFGRYQPFLVSYCKARELVKPVVHSGRSKRSVVKVAKKTVRPKNPFLERWTQREKSCQIHTLYVSFRDLHWQDWIIAPDGFGAFFCHGECSFPLNAQMNATNHALIQSLVHSISPGRVPKPCCAPTKLNPISVLYHIDDANINLKKYKNMVVKSCGCM